MPLPVAVPRCNWKLSMAVVSMVLGSAWAWWTLPSPYRWLPALLCLGVGTWLLRLPTAPPRR